MYCIDRKGNLILNFRKKYLFKTDEKFYLSGEQYSTIKIKNREN